MIDSTQLSKGMTVKLQQKKSDDLDSPSRSISNFLLRWAGTGTVTVTGRLANCHIVMAVVLGDQADAWPFRNVVVRVVGYELLCVGHVKAEGLDGVLQCIAQQEHLHLVTHINTHMHLGGLQKLCPV